MTCHSAGFILTARPTLLTGAFGIRLCKASLNPTWQVIQRLFVLGQPQDVRFVNDDRNAVILLKKRSLPAFGDTTQTRL